MNKRYHKHNQYDFSKLVNENREKSIFANIALYKNHFKQISASLPGRAVWKTLTENDTLQWNPCYIFSVPTKFNFDRKWKGCFFSPWSYAHEEGEGACLVFPRKGLRFHIHVASSLKPLSYIYSTHITSLFVDKLAMNV